MTTTVRPTLWQRVGFAPRPLAGLEGAYSTSLVGQFRKNLGLFVLGTAVLVGQQVLMAQRDFLVRTAVDSVDRGASEAAVRAAVLMLVVSAVAAVARFLSRATMFASGRNVEYELRAALLARLHRLGPSFFGKVATGDIMSRATNDLQQVRLLLGFGVLNVVSSAFGLVSALFVMFTISWQLTLAALGIWPLLALVTRRFSGLMFKRNRESQQAIGEMSDRVLASLAGVRVVRSFAMEDAELVGFDVANRRYLDTSLALARVRGSIGPIMGALGSLGVLVVFVYGGYLLADGTLSKGDFVSFWLALLRLTWPMLAIGFVTSIVQRGRASYARLATVLRAEPDVVDGALPAPAEVRGALAVRGLSFAYGDRKVLDDVSFEVEAGRSLAILGRTGSGKSTLAALLPRLRPTPRGAVFLDGVDVCDLPLETVRGSIGYAQQDAFLFSTTAGANIGYALDPDELAAGAAAAGGVDPRVRAAAREAQVEADIERLPEGFDTVVGERGVQLSGGQKQRVALGRALIREPAVLVLDDPLSAVDARTEAAILEAIDRQKARRTVVLITHRVAAARRCDEVCVLDHGRVIERGTHEELLAAGGLYALFAEEQAMEAELAAISVPDPGTAAAEEEE
ncbi:MAG: ABC transporter ATP-binding protein [Myxococcales bacterium]|nr:ABC transporter ATP-binding protein [Myxococcales bacterium]